MEIDEFYENKEENSVHQEEEQKEIEQDENKSQLTQVQNTNLERSLENNPEETQKENNNQRKGLNVKESGTKKTHKNFVKKRDRQKPKIGLNPFLPENNYEYKTQNIISKHQKNIHSSRGSYLLNYKNEISDGKEQRHNKSVFSKISEMMYLKTKDETLPRKKERDLQKEGEENYDKFTEEAYLLSHANKANKENQKIIEEFLERKKKEEMADKVGIDSDKEKENELEPFQDAKRSNIITDRNILFKSKRTVQEFLEDQKNKEEKHKTHLKANAKLYNDQISLSVYNKPMINEETIKLANNGNRNKRTDIHQRLYEEFNEIKQKKEKNEKEKSYLNKNKEKKIPKSNIQKSVERLFNEYETKKKIMDENMQKKEKEIKIRSSSRSASKISNKIIFKRFKKTLENSFNNVLNKKLEENFEINFSDFILLLYKINFTVKNYFELMQKENNPEEEEIKQSMKALSNYKQNKFEYDIEYKLLIDAWKIISKNKTFKTDLLGSSRRVLIFCLSVLGIYEENINQGFFKREFPFLCDPNEINKYSNLSRQIYKYFSIYKNNAIDGLLFRERDNKKRMEILKEKERFLTFNPVLEKSQKKLMSHLNPTRLSVEKNYQQYQINKELKLKEKEKIILNTEKEKCPFEPCVAKKQGKTKVDVSEISKRLFVTSLKHLKVSNSEANTFSVKDKLQTYLSDNIHKPNPNYKKMFNKNPLESDNDVKKKIQNMEKLRNKKAYEKLILKKGFKPKEDIVEVNLNTQENFRSERFALEDELTNTFKDTFDKYERMSKKKSKKNNDKKCEFEIIIDRKPRKLIIYQNDDINCKVKEFCNKYNLDFNDKRRILQVINRQLNESSILIIN